MDYEKKYNEAQKWIESIYTELSHERQMEAKAFFPELKESKDDKVRKQILSFLKEFERDHYRLLDFSSWIALLEKQGDKDKLIKELGEYKVKYTQEVLESHINSMSIKEKAHQIAWETSKHYDPNACKQEWCEMAAIDMAAWLEKQGASKTTKGIFEVWKDMRCEIYAQASGNRHEPNCSDNTTKLFSLNDIDELIEKLGEQKPTDKTAPKVGRLV